MKNKIIYYVFTIAFVWGSIIFLLQKAGVLLPKIIRNYVNDFLIIPIILSISLYTMQKIRNDKEYVIPLPVILYLCALYAVFFEYFLPQFHRRYTADWWDVVLYFIGGFIFYFLQKTINKKEA